MPRQLQPSQLLTPVPSDIAISDAIAPLPISEIAHAAGIVRTLDLKGLSTHEWDVTKCVWMNDAAPVRGGSVRQRQG